MATFDNFNYLEVFDNISNCDMIYIYAITNFDPKNKALIREQSVNHLQLIRVGLAKGLVMSTVKRCSVKLQNITQKDSSLEIVSEIGFGTNDNIEYLFNDKNTSYCITINKPFLSTDEQDLFLIQSASIDRLEVNKLNYIEKAIDENKEIEEVMPPNKVDYQLNLVSFNSIVNITSTKIKFKLLPEWPKKNIYKPEPDRINWLKYTLPNNSVYQTLNVYGDMYNVNTGEWKEETLLPLQIMDSDSNKNIYKPQALPILVDLNSLDSPAQLNIKSFNLNYQLPYTLIKDINSKGLNSIWDRLVDGGLNGNIVLNTNNPDGSAKTFNSIEARKIQKLLLKMYIITQLYQSNFEIWKNKKNDADSVNIINTTYGHYKNGALDYNKDLIEDFLTKNPEFRSTIIWDIFKAVCLACSSFIISPYMWNQGSDDNFKLFLWYYIEFVGDKNIFSNWIKYFDEQTLLIDDNKLDEIGPDGIAYPINLNVKFMSYFFELKKCDNDDEKYVLIYKNNALINTNLNTSIGNYKTVPQLPAIINNVNDDWSPYSKELSSNKMKYLCFLFFKSDITDFISRWTKYFIDANVIEKRTLSFKNKRPTRDDFFCFKIAGVNDENYKIQKIETLPDTKLITYADCGKMYNRIHNGIVNPYYSTRDVIAVQHGDNPSEEDQQKDFCYIWFDEIRENYQNQLNNTDYQYWLKNKDKDGKAKIYKRNVIKEETWYSASAIITYKYTQKLINNFYLQDPTSLSNLLNPNNEKSKQSIDVWFELDKEWTAKGWVIKNISSDRHRSFFNSATHLTINFDQNYTNPDSGKMITEKNKLMDYDLDYSFQKNNPSCCLTQNHY